MDKREKAERTSLLIEQCDGIQPHHVDFYVHSIGYAAERASAAFQAFDAHVSAQASPTVIFAALQEALGHAAALSRFFWPSAFDGKLAIARGEKLRAVFDVVGNSPLEGRDLRNSLEHFDARLDDFLLTDPFGCFFPAPIVAEHGLIDEPGGNIFKLVDPDAQICVLLGNKFEFGTVRQEVERIYSVFEKIS